MKILYAVAVMEWDEIVLIVLIVTFCLLYLMLLICNCLYDWRNYRIRAEQLRQRQQRLSLLLKV